MRIHVLSDLHLGHGDFCPPRIDAEVVVLAGDIGRGAQGVEWANEAFPDTPVVYVPGNHEFYHWEIRAALDAMRKAAASHVHVLDNQCVEIGGVRFLGATLWTDFDLYGPVGGLAARRLARQVMPDFSCVALDGRRFTPEASMALHAISRNWLEASLLDDGQGKPTVVVTHHVPCGRSIGLRFRAGQESVLNPAFVSNLEPLLERHKGVWVHGHTHDSLDYSVSGSHVVCNPRGYCGEELNPLFNPELALDVEAGFLDAKLDLASKLVVDNNRV